jgi:phenylalanine ammonia-lyase
MLAASYLYILCQAMDLRALQADLVSGLKVIVIEELETNFASLCPTSQLTTLGREICKVMADNLESTSTMDCSTRMAKVAASSTTLLVDFFTSTRLIEDAVLGSTLRAVPTFRSSVASRAVSLMNQLRGEYLSGARGAAPASTYLQKTRPVYDFIRITLGIRMHGSENYNRFQKGLGTEHDNIGQHISLIHEVTVTILSSDLADDPDLFL